MARTFSAPRSTQLELVFDAYLNELDAVDASLGAYLLETAIAPASAPAATRRGSPAWWRALVSAWCRLPSTAARFDHEAVGSVGMAAEHMEDELLLPWIRSLLAAGTAVRLPNRPAA